MISKRASQAKDRGKSVEDRGENTSEAGAREENTMTLKRGSVGLQWLEQKAQDMRVSWQGQDWAAKPGQAGPCRPQ